MHAKTGSGLEHELIAAVDLGSNSFRLQVGQVRGNQIYELDGIKETVRLGAGLGSDKQLDGASQLRALTALSKFGERLRGFHPDAVRAVCAAVHKPVNFMVGIRGKSFTRAELEAAGVRRISLATSLYRVAMTAALDGAREVKDKGTFGYLDRTLATPDINTFLQA